MVPAQKNELSAADCRSVILNKLEHNDFRIVEHELVPFEQKCGYLGEHLKLYITIETNGATERVGLFAKFLPTLQTQIDFVLTSGAFVKEIFVYEELFKVLSSPHYPTLRSHIPHCFFTRPNHVLVFENLMDAGYKALPKFDYLDYEHVAAVIRSLAVLHAATLIFEEKTSKRIIDLYPDSFEETFYTDRNGHVGIDGLHAAAKGIKTEIDLFYDEMSLDIPKDLFKERAYDVCLRMSSMVKPSKKYRNVVCHGDLWCTNILMKYERDVPVESMVIDFQTVRYVPPAHDVMSVLYLTASRRFRDANADKIKSLYYAELGGQLAAHGLELDRLLPRQEFLDSCEEEKAFAVPQHATYSQMTQISAAVIDEFGRDDARWNDALYKDRSELVAEGCARDPEYRRKLRDTLEDMRELC